MFRATSTRLSYKSAIAFNSPNPAPDLPPAFFWLDAADAVNGATSWTSKEGKVFTSSTITKTANAINGLPVLNGQSHLLTLGTGVTMEAGATVFLVGILGTTAGARIVSQNNGIVLDYETSGGTMPMNGYSSTAWETLKISVGGVARVSSLTQAPHLFAHRRNGTAVTNLAYRSGAWSTSATGTTNAVTASFKKFGLGTCGDYGWDGQVAEVIYFDSYLSDTQYNKVRDMLLTKYALS